jgi:hypothetical protein
MTRASTMGCDSVREPAIGAKAVALRTSNGGHAIEWGAR